MNNNCKTKKGFSLIEVIMAMFIFVLMMLTVTSVFATMVKTRRKALSTQRNMEDIRYVMEFMAKNIRMSSVDGLSGLNKIYIYNYSQEKCMFFQFNSSDKKILFGETPQGSRIAYPDCSSNSISYPESELAFFGEANKISKVIFYYEPFGDSSLGQVTILIGMEGQQENAQTTVSLRNYNEISGVAP